MSEGDCGEMAPSRDKKLYCFKDRGLLFAELLAVGIPTTRGTESGSYVQTKLFGFEPALLRTDVGPW